MSKITDSQVQDIIDGLRGTCDTLDGAIVEVVGDGSLESTDLTENQLSKIDQQIFLCDDCGWWCEISEQSEIEAEQVCNDCEEIR